jgi:hypothetical protein
MDVMCIVSGLVYILLALYSYEFLKISKFTSTRIFFNKKKCTEELGKRRRKKGPIKIQENREKNKKKIRYMQRLILE